VSAERARRAQIIAQKFAKQGDTNAAQYWEQKAEDYRKAGK